VVFPQQKRVAPKLRVFVDFLISIFDPPPWKVATAVRAIKPPAARASQRATSRATST
jgi:hypothetical protein